MFPIYSLVNLKKIMSEPEKKRNKLFYSVLLQRVVHKITLQKYAKISDIKGCKYDVNFFFLGGGTIRVFFHTTIIISW